MRAFEFFIFSIQLNILFFRNFGLLLLTGQSDGFGLFGRPSRGGDVSRGPFEDKLRQLAHDFQGLSGRMQGPLEAGRCASRENNQCCVGSDWNCQAPGSTCSCDQVNLKSSKLWVENLIIWSKI